MHIKEITITKSKTVEISKRIGQEMYRKISITATAELGNMDDPHTAQKDLSSFIDESINAENHKIRDEYQATIKKKKTIT